MDNEAKLREAKRKVDSMIGLPDMPQSKGTVTVGEPMMGTVDYNWRLIRVDSKRWLFMCEWVDIDGEGHRITLPHQVCEAMFRAREVLIKKTRSNAAKRTTELIKRRSEKNE